MKKNSSKRKHCIQVSNRPRTSEAKKRQKVLQRMRTAEKLMEGIYVR